MAFSLVNRAGRGENWNRMLLHAIWRSAALIFLGIFLRSLSRGQTYWTFEDTLTQIGLGYTFLFLLAFAARNTDPVTLRFYFDLAWQMPLVALLLAFFVAGALLEAQHRFPGDGKAEVPGLDRPGVHRAAGACNGGIPGL